MKNTDGMIMVVNRVLDEANKLTRLIQFMDVNNVCAAEPERWQKKIGDKRLEAVFVGADLTDQDVDKLLLEVSQIDPNVPVVMMSNSQSVC